jgi:dihydropteroate synthase-like protein
MADSRTRGFVTGKLAAPALRRLLARLEPELDFRPVIIELNIDVAALLTTDWVARKLELSEELESIVLPGYCRGELAAIEDATGIKAERGPRDLRKLPEYLGRQAVEDDYGEHDIEIIAEINHVPQLDPEEVLAIARRYASEGADIIDLGCDPDGPFEAVGELVGGLRDEGFRVSVDSLDPREIEPAVAAGAELVLSVNSSNLDVARSLGCEVVLIPDETQNLAGIDENVTRLESWGVPYRIDPVMEPIGFGFARSLGRYLEIRRRYPEAEIMMGIGNLTELTDADSAPINLVLLGFCQELGIRSVLTTAVIHWASTSVRECALARKLVHYACANGVLPKHREPDLHLLRDPSILEHGTEVIEELAAGLRDRNFRLFAEDGELHVASSEGLVRGKDPFEIFDQLAVDDPSHAFYLGYEMAKAITALTLNKNYVQDEALRWGFLTREEKSHLDRRKERPEK